MGGCKCVYGCMGVSMCMGVSVCMGVSGETLTEVLRLATVATELLIVVVVLKCKVGH